MTVKEGATTYYQNSDIPHNPTDSISFSFDLSPGDHDLEFKLIDEIDNASICGNNSNCTAITQTQNQNFVVRKSDISIVSDQFLVAVEDEVYDIIDITINNGSVDGNINTTNSAILSLENSTSLKWYEQQNAASFDSGAISSAQ